MSCWISSRDEAKAKSEAEAIKKKNHIKTFWHMFCLIRLGKNQVNIYEYISQGFADGHHSMRFALLLSSSIPYCDGATRFLFTAFTVFEMLEPECLAGVCR